MTANPAALAKWTHANRMARHAYNVDMGRIEDRVGRIDALLYVTNVGW